MLGGLHNTHSIMLKLIEKGLNRQLAYKIVQESAMESWNNKKEFTEILLKNKKLKKLITSEDIKIMIRDTNNLQNIDWIYKNKIK